MINNKVSLRYSSSFLDNAIEKNILDVVSRDAELVKSALEGNPQLKRIIESPVIKSQVKLSIIDEIFKDKIDKETLNFIHFIIDKNREELLLNIFTKFFELKDDYLGIVRVDVKTAFELNDEQKTKLKENLEKMIQKRVVIETKIDKEVIGGFVARVGDTVYDASIKHQLELLKKQFLEGSVSFN